LCSPAANFDVVLGTRTLRDARIGKIRYVRKQLLEALLEERYACRRLLDAFVKRRNLGAEPLRLG
jgi:hypothetical protein